MPFNIPLKLSQLSQNFNPSTIIFAPMQETILILDFGSQYTQLIARRVRELNIFCEIFPFDKIPTDLSSYKAVILGGSPASVRSEEVLHPQNYASKKLFHLILALNLHSVHMSNLTECLYSISFFMCIVICVLSIPLRIIIE